MTRFFKQAALLAAMGLAIYGTEAAVTFYFGDQTLAPLLSVLCCAGLVFLGSPRLNLAAIPLFAVESYLLIMDSSKYPLIRSVTMILGGLLAYWACRQKKNLEERVSEVELVLSSMSTPWILCDRSGNIGRLSASASELVGESLNSLHGSSFFSRFSGGPSKGELIQKFLRAADSRLAVDRVGLNLAYRPNLKIDASFIPIRTKEGVGILVVFASDSFAVSHKLPNP